MAVRVAPLALAALLLGCTASTETTTRSTTTAGGSSIPDSTAPPSTVGTTSTTPAPASTTTTSSVPGFTPEQQAVADGYQRAMSAFDRAYEKANPIDPGLAETMVDPMLRQQRVNLTNLFNAGEAARLPEPSVRRHVVATVVIDGNAATLTGCTIDDAILYKVATGEVVNDEVSTADVSATLRLVLGVWKLETREFSNKRNGVVACG